MFHFRRPTGEVIKSFLQTQSRLDFTYFETGATATTPPTNYVVDHARVRLGTGERVFRRARTGLEGWKQFDVGWLHAFPVAAPIRPAEVVAVVARAFGIWSLNAARIVYVVDDPRRFGFAYGTLPGHVERGEERFLVEIADDHTVWYDIKAFSRPRHVLTKFGYPYVRRLQLRFGRESAAAMRRFVNETAEIL